MENTENTTNGTIQLTQEELNALLQKEGDKRVSSALETAKSKWQMEQENLLNQKQNEWKSEYERQAMLTAEEKAKEQLESTINEYNQKNSALNFKANMLTAKESLSGAGIPKEHYEKFLNTLVSDKEDVTTENVNNFINLFSSTKTELEKEIKTSLGNVIPPVGGKGSGGGEMTKADFNKLSYADKLKVKTDNPELFAKFIK